MHFQKVAYLKKKITAYDVLFPIAMWWRIFYGFFRLVLGFILIPLAGVPLSDVVRTIMGHEIIEDPGDILLQVVNPILDHLSFLTVTHFLAGYLIFWALVDIVLSINLLRHKTWAFPASIYSIGIFVLYEIYRLSYTHSLILAGVILVDLIILWLIKNEYAKLTASAYNKEVYTATIESASRSPMRPPQE